MDNNTKRSVELLQKCEAMTLLCTRATHYWSIVKTAFQIPLILTSSIMCVLNSFGTVETSMKIPNVVVNGISVILISYQSNLKVAEKVELFKQLSNSFLGLAHQIEGMDIEELDKNTVNNIYDKYDTFVMSCLFEEIPKRYKLEVIKLFEGKALPLQLNGGSGLCITKVKDHTVHKGDLIHQLEV